jgi:hypothetical protein
LIFRLLGTLTISRFPFRASVFAAAKICFGYCSASVFLCPPRIHFCRSPRAVRAFIACSQFSSSIGQARPFSAGSTCFGLRFRELGRSISCCRLQFCRPSYCLCDLPPVFVVLRGEAVRCWLIWSLQPKLFVIASAAWKQILLLTRRFEWLEISYFFSAFCGGFLVLVFDEMLVSQ